MSHLNGVTSKGRRQVALTVPKAGHQAPGVGGFLGDDAGDFQSDQL